MDRRRFIGTLAGGLVIARYVTDAQTAEKVYRIGFLVVGTAESAVGVFRAFNEALRDLDYVEGRHFILDPRYAGGRLERLPDQAAELVRLRADVIVAGTNPAVAAAKRATATIPIVMASVVDPVGAGFIENLARPGGNITGVTVDASPELLGKNLSLLTEIVPTLFRVGVLRQLPYVSGFDELETAARKLNVRLNVVDIRSPDDFEGAFVAMVRNQVGDLQ